ncbi:glycosyltransferase [Helicobacter sp. 11S03491-1]|uniref:glycosyltransferase n=1 Tax=Helicobacter sp. 11S03491-1 TaxID=1476196 RepID=UPI000BA5FCA2|nr:glycosyltransferase [Helicobacter sp. 11S03491-1]PAF43790.1 hypothetical protein BKH45_00550 [Helicobacter sp. 11S03491-1]
MKILHLVSQDFGGAGRAALRLHLALLDQANAHPNESIESLMLVQEKSTDYKSVLRLAKTTSQKIMQKARPALCRIPLIFYPKRHQDIFSTDFIPNPHLIKTINHLQPDIVHLHWINNGFLNIKDLKKIKAPLLWSLHDSNAYTGGCHVVYPHCNQAQTHCQKCPFLKSHFKFDLSFWIFAKKAKTYSKLNLTINGLSRWITQCAKESALLKDKKIINLPNPIDTNIYCPIPKDSARDILKLHQSQKIIAFGALSATSLARKGYFELKEALKFLKNKDRLKLVIFGASGDENGETPDVSGIQTHYLGHLQDDISLRLVYSAADVMVTPSLCESFGQTASESLSCGTPVVCFDTSGLKDIIDHQKTGYLAKAFDPLDLARGIEWVLGLDPQAYQSLSQEGRKKVLTTFNAQKIAKQYIQNYKEILNAPTS